MNRSTGKMTTFLFGLVAGVLLGGTVAYVLFSRKTAPSPASQAYQLEPQATPKVTPVAVNTTVIEASNQENSTNSEIENPEQAIVETENDSTLVLDSVAIDSTLAEYNAIDSSHLKTIPFDSTTLASTSTAVDTFDNEIVVREDELVWNSSKTIIYLGEAVETPSRIDSLIEQTSGVRMEDRVEEISLEFWQSPINYKGYKLGKKKLLLYGIDKPDSTWIYNVNEQLYLKTTKTIYQLDYTDNFKSYRPVNDPDVIKVLKQ